MRIVEVKVKRGEVSFGTQKNANKAAADDIRAWLEAMREEIGKRKSLPKKGREK